MVTPSFELNKFSIDRRSIFDIVMKVMLIMRLNYLRLDSTTSTQISLTSTFIQLFLPPQPLISLAACVLPDHVSGPFSSSSYHTWGTISSMTSTCNPCLASTSTLPSTVLHLN